MTDPRWVQGNRWDVVADDVGRAVPSSVAVIVPYFEQPESLQRMYAALGDLDPARVELVVVDDGSRRPPPPPPDAFPLGVRLLRQPDLGCRPGAARNLGAAATAADVLVFLDADTLPSRGTVMRLAQWPSVLPDALVVGRRHHVDLAGWTPEATTAWLDDRREPPPRRPDPAWLDAGYERSADLLHADGRSYRYVISAVMACHRTLWDDIAGFDGTRDEYGGDDWEFAYRAFNNGAVLVHDPTAVAWHDEPDWEQRSGGTKNPETLWLASVIPEPLTRGRGSIHADADMLVELTGDDVDDGRLAVAVTSMLQARPDCRVQLPGASSSHLVHHFRHDPRVQLAPPTDRQRQRARHSLVVRGLVRWDGAALAAACEEVDELGLLALDATAGDEVVATLTSTRMAGRAQRAARLGVTDPGAAGVGPRHRVAVERIGAHVVAGGVDLAATFGGW